MCCHSLHRRLFFIITSKLVTKAVYSLHVSCPTVPWLGELSNEILDPQHENCLADCPGVGARCIALNSEDGGQMKGTVV